MAAVWYPDTARGYIAGEYREQRRHIFVFRAHAHLRLVLDKPRNTIRNALWGISSKGSRYITHCYFPCTLYSPWIYSDAFIREVDLTKNDHLRVICLPSACIRPNHEDLGAAGRFPRFLAQVSSPFIEEVFMEITVTLLSQLNVIDWQTISRIFANFQSLRRVQLTIRSQLLACWKPDFRETTVAWVESRLPDCRMKGILEIKFR